MAVCPLHFHAATHTAGKAHGQAASASRGATIRVAEPRYSGGPKAPAPPDEPRAEPQAGRSRRDRGDEARVGPRRAAMRRKGGRPPSPRLRCSAAPRQRRPRPPPLQPKPRPPGAMTPASPDPLTSRDDGAEPCTEAMYRSTSALLRLIAPPNELPASGRPAPGPTAAAVSRR